MHANLAGCSGTGSRWKWWALQDSNLPHLNLYNYLRLASTLDSSLLPYLTCLGLSEPTRQSAIMGSLAFRCGLLLPPDFELAEALMRVQSQSRVMPNVFKVGNVFKRLILDADMEILYAYRIRQMLADKDPVIAPIDRAD